MFHPQPEEAVVWMLNSFHAGPPKRGAVILWKRANSHTFFFFCLFSLILNFDTNLSGFASFSAWAPHSSSFVMKQTFLQSFVGSIPHCVIDYVDLFISQSMWGIHQLIPPLWIIAAGSSRGKQWAETITLANKKRSNKKLDFRGKTHTSLENTKSCFGRRHCCFHPLDIKKGIVYENVWNHVCNRLLLMLFARQNVCFLYLPQNIPLFLA